MYRELQVRTKRMMQLDGNITDGYFFIERTEMSVVPNIFVC